MRGAMYVTRTLFRNKVYTTVCLEAEERTVGYGVTANIAASHRVGL